MCFFTAEAKKLADVRRQQPRSRPGLQESEDKNSKRSAVSGNKLADVRRKQTSTCPGLQITVRGSIRTYPPTAVSQPT
jgi:hypothetical protein